MEEDSLFTPPPPNSLMHQYHDNHHDGQYANRDTYRGLLASNLVLLIVLPLLVLASLAVVAFVVLRVCRSRGRSKPENISGNVSGYNSSFRKPSFGANPGLSKCGSDLDAKVFINSPDVGSCIYGGKLGFTALQVRNNKRLGQVFTYKELEVATDGFSESNVIGNGGFGVVFRGRLSDGTVAAIKKLHKEGKHAEREFRTEV